MSEGIRVGAVIAAFFAGSAILSAYLPLWLADRGLAATTIGTVLGGASLARVVAVPLIGWGVDRLAAWRLSMIAAGLVTSACAWLLPAAAGVLPIAALVVAGGVAASALTPLADAVTLALAAAGRLHYGPTRAFGSVAYMVATMAGGVLLGRLGSSSVPLLLATSFGAAGLLAMALPEAAPGVSAPAELGDAAGLGRRFWWVLLASALIQGSHAAYYAFASLYWRRSGLADATIGVLIGEGIVMEIALFVWGRRVVEWLGPARLTTIAAVGAAVRWVGLGLTTAVPALALLQVLHGASFACQHLSSMQVLRRLPAGRAGLAQTLLAALGFSLPTGVLTWVSGEVYARAGGAVFFVMAVVAALGLAAAPRLPGGARRRSG